MIALAENPRVREVPTPPALRRAVEEGWLDFTVRLPVGRALVTFKEAAIALARMGENGRVNNDFIQNLVDAGELVAIASKPRDGERTSSRITALSVRLYAARKMTLPAEFQANQVMQLIRDLCDDLPLDQLARVLAHVEKIKHERIEKRRGAR